MDPLPDRPPDDGLWYKDAIFYEVYVRGFFDSNGDGNGDLRGLIEKLPYLSDLGVELSVAHADLRLAAQGRRLRYGRFPRHSPHPRHDRGLRGADRGRSPARHSHHHRPGPQPHLRPASLVPGGPARPLFAAPRLLRLERHHRSLPGRAHHLQGQRALELDLGRRSPSSTTGTAFTAISPTSITTIRPSAGRSWPSWRTGWTAASMASGSMPSPTSTSARAPIAKTCPRPTPFAGRCGSFVDAHYPGTLLLAEANQWPHDLLPYFGEGERVPHGLQFPAHAAHVHGHPPRAVLADRSRSWTRCPRSRQPANGPSSCATTMS